MDNYEKWYAEKCKNANRRSSDDIFTPPRVMRAVVEWVCKEYGIDPADIVRPFYPGGDYQREDYTGKVVVDNPPFSRETEIIRFFSKKGVRYFIFCSALAAPLRSSNLIYDRLGMVVYDNKVKVRTAFATNLSRHKIEVHDILPPPECSKRKVHEYPPGYFSTATFQAWCKTAPDNFFLDADEIEIIKTLPSGYKPFGTTFKIKGGFNDEQTD